MISGMDFWNKTKLGAELKKFLPPKTSRVIIDIPCDGAVKIYASCYPEKMLFDLNWPEIINKCEIVERSDNEKRN